MWGGMRQDMVNGSVKWFDEARGLGFLELPAGGPDIFVHYSNILMEGHKVLCKGDLVSFELDDGPKGLLAYNVQLTWRNAFPKPGPVVQHRPAPRRRIIAHRCRPVPRETETADE